MKQIWKFTLGHTPNQVKEIPSNYSILAAQMQNGCICVWVAVDPEAERIPVKFRVIGTGREFESKGLLYIATVQDGAFVWHIFTDLN